MLPSCFLDYIMVFLCFLIMLGAIVYIKNDLDLGTSVEGLVVAMSLIGATAITTCSGAISDWLGRRPMLIISSCFTSLGFGHVVFIHPRLPIGDKGIVKYITTIHRFRENVFVILYGFWDAIDGLTELEFDAWSSIDPFSLVFCLDGSLFARISSVTREMALLVEGLGIGGETSIEEYLIGPADELDEGHEPCADKDKIRLYGSQVGLSWVAKPVTGQSILSLTSRQGSMVNQSVSLIDPLVTLFGSVHEMLPETGSTRSMLSQNFGSMFSTAEPHVRNEHWDEESLKREGDDYASDAAGARLCKTVESVGGTGIGGGWQLTWKWSEREECEFIQAAALVSQPALYSKELMDQRPVGPAMVHPAETASKVPLWAALLDPGVKLALLVGVGIQILQQCIHNLANASLHRCSHEAHGYIRQKLIVLVFSEIVDLGTVVNAAISTACVIIYFCCFVMGYGPIPNILGSEIFPTRVRGLCIAVCALVYWIGYIIVTYTLPVMLSSIGLAGVFGMYAVVCLISWVFVFLKVRRPKGNHSKSSPSSSPCTTGRCYERVTNSTLWLLHGVNSSAISPVKKHQMYVYT
ncbi:putative DNA binding protein [Hibiscus syriacus]|uniref:DNA binding protein n=1 Tax=Hibiscus syriacus TaxID=106335 RepID=A0A6A3AJG2_HIBSY|nr:putative DNA binding protein [Hibiscus syriacus]